MPQVHLGATRVGIGGSLTRDESTGAAVPASAGLLDGEGIAVADGDAEGTGNAVTVHPSDLASSQSRSSLVCETYARHSASWSAPVTSCQVTSCPHAFALSRACTARSKRGLRSPIM
jgi:hypothetical protein